MDIPRENTCLVKKQVNTCSHMCSACNGVGVVVDQLHARFVVNLIERPPI